MKYIHVVDEKPQSTSAGQFDQDAWRTRDLNTIKTDETGSVSLSSNQLTLPAGTYICKIYAFARSVGKNKAKLRNITDSTDVLFGHNMESNGGTVVPSIIAGKFTISSSKTFEIQHKCGTTHSSGFGVTNELGVDPELYLIAEFWKVEDVSILEVTCV